MRRFWHGGLATVLCTLGSVSASDDDAKSDRANWTNWRGADGARALETGPKVLKFGGEQFRWKVALPGKGSSTPIVVDGRIFVTVPVEGVDALLCFDADGQQVFQTIFGAENPGKHRRGSGANASPVSDGQDVFVYFKSGTLASVDGKGAVNWQVDLVEKYGRESLYWDHGTSPILTERYVVMARMDERDSWLAAFDKKTGELAWKVERNYTTPRECDHGYSTPIVIQHDGQESILTWGAEQITIHQALDGKLVWSCGNFNPEKNELWPTIASPVVVGDMAVVAYGRADRGTPRLFGVRLSGQGDVTKTNHVWSRDDIGAFVPTPLVHGKEVIVLGDRGDVECLNPQTGETIWKDKYPQARANFYASPLLLGPYLYAIREDGAAFVSEIEGRSVKLLAENEMQQDIVGSPVPFGDSILIRGETHLFCIAPE
ncbi:MAG: PQQ-binding-like beta-propeller repeat protein [Planctomycetaceae bacterium]|nr:PQQ-binding-like beta-propeller repeat protein [Planctomycetaceae bacterium]